MPQCKQLRTLKEASLYSIAKNMDRIWCKDYRENLLGKGQFMYVDGPFDCLPGSLVNDIIQTLKKEQMLRRYHLHLLITSNLDRLDLERGNIDMPLVLNFIACRCKKILKELKLAYCSKLPKADLKNMLASLQNLEVLNLGWTNITDDDLGVLGQNCSKLRDLNVTACHQISDKGVEYLCSDEAANKTSGNHGRVGKCKLLAILHIQDTKVTRLGVKAALCNLPKLQLLNHPETVAALNSLHYKEWQEGLPLPSYNLRSLFADYRMESFNEDVASLHNSLSLAADICPLTSDMHILGFGDSPDVLLSLCKLKHLKVLDVIIDETQIEDNNGSMSKNVQKDMFSRGIVPVLQICGNSITTLSLGEFSPKVDVGIIGYFCPMLEDLNLAFNKGYTSRFSDQNPCSPVSRRPFSSLKKLNLVCVCSNLMIYKDLRKNNQADDDDDCSRVDLPYSHLKDLLSSPVLEKIFIRESTTLTNTILKEVLKEGQTFSFLKEIELEQCHNVTSQFVYFLLNLSGPLKSMKLWECKQITRADFNSFKSLVRKNKWDLSIDWM